MRRKDVLYAHVEIQSDTTWCELIAVEVNGRSSSHDADIMLQKL